jgi:hypothetical protein
MALFFEPFPKFYLSTGILTRTPAMATAENAGVSFKYIALMAQGKQRRSAGTPLRPDGVNRPFHALAG